MGISVKKIMPLAAFKKNANEYVKTVREEDGPILLTVNGSSAVVVEDAERYEEMSAKVEENTALKQELHDLQQAIALKTLLDGRMQNFDKSKLFTPEQARAKVLKNK